MAKVSICAAIWNTSHLLGRFLDTLTRQEFDDFEVVLIDDNSEDSVEDAVAPYYDKLNIKIHRLTHRQGMRGNTISFNVAFSLAHGDIICENTPEIMFAPNTLKDLVDQLESMPRPAWVSVRTYNITPEDQLVMDDFDWKTDIYNLEKMPNFYSEWTQNNAKKREFGTHQTCVYYRDDWFRYIKRFPLFADYGTDDPFFSGARQRAGFTDYTIEPFVFHSWHPPLGFWMSHGKAPNWNLWGHTMCNWYNDPAVPAGGTAMLWDTDKEQGPYHQMNEEEAEGWLQWTDTVVKSGFRRKDGRDL